MRLKSLLLLCVMFSLSSCSVYMAAKGNDEVDLSVLKPGTKRSAVEAVFGKPVAPLRPDTESGVVSYQYFTGDEPSTQRAVVYGILDVATLGIAEVVGTPVEALQGDKHIVEVNYDKENVVQAVNIYFLRAPLAKPEKFLGVDCVNCGRTVHTAARRSNLPSSPARLNNIPSNSNYVPF